MAVAMERDALLLTRDDLHAELQRFVRQDLHAELGILVQESFAAGLHTWSEESFAQQLQKLGEQVQEDVREGIQTLFKSAPLKTLLLDPLNSSTEDLDLEEAAHERYRRAVSKVKSQEDFTESDCAKWTRQASGDSHKSKDNAALQASAEPSLDSSRPDGMFLTPVVPAGGGDYRDVPGFDLPWTLPGTVQDDDAVPVPVPRRTRRSTLSATSLARSDSVDVGEVGETSRQTQLLRDEARQFHRHLEKLENRGPRPSRQSTSGWDDLDPRLLAMSELKRSSVLSRIKGYTSPVADTLSTSFKRLSITEPRWMRRVRRIVKHDYFDHLMGIVLVCNAISIGLQTNYMAQQDTGTVPTGFRLMTGLFCILFTIELVMRMLCHGRGFLTPGTPGWQWNAFDLVVVVFQVIDEVTQFIVSGAEIPSSISILRMLRICRVVRLIRMVRLIPELKNMVYLIFASMWSFFWTAVLLVLQMYFFAVYYTEVYTDLKHDFGNTDPSIGSEIGEHWGSLGSSMFSLFMAITGGDDWKNFLEGFSSYSYVLHTIVFSMYVAFATLVMLNLVTGVFVEGAQRIVREDEDAGLVKQVCKIFYAADNDGSHEISWFEFEEQLNNAAMADYFKAVDLSLAEAKGLFQLLDADESGSLTIEEFVHGCLRLKGPARSVDLASLVHDFRIHCRIQKERQMVVENRLRMLAITVDSIESRNASKSHFDASRNASKSHFDASRNASKSENEP